jgi:GMP synthase (glutamine-hydrolysing)
MSRSVLILRHMLQETAGTLEAALTRAGLDFRYIDLFQEVPAELPLDQAAGLIVLGGPMNVDEVDRYPFLKLDVQWIRQAIKTRLPMLGICLGAQLLAKALGSRVHPNPIKEIGWYRLDWLSAAADDPLFAQTGTSRVFQWHGDTFQLPKDAVLLAKGSSCQNQAFRWGSNAYGLQFHIEMTAEMIERWLTRAEERAELNRTDISAIRLQTPMFLREMQQLAADVFDRFARMCAYGGKSHEAASE